MTDNKHTPGPWEAGNIGDQGWTVLAGGEIVAVIGGGGNGEDFDPAYQADARLIAAAPELLGVLQAIHQQLVAQGINFGPLIADAEAAIAKATAA